MILYGNIYLHSGFMIVFVESIKNLLGGQCGQFKRAYEARKELYNTHPR